jgi:hypothetical protein
MEDQGGFTLAIMRRHTNELLCVRIDAAKTEAEATGSSM